MVRRYRVMKYRQPLVSHGLPIAPGELNMTVAPEESADDTAELPERREALPFGNNYGATMGNRIIDVRFNAIVVRQLPRAAVPEDEILPNLGATVRGLVIVEAPRHLEGDKIRQGPDIAERVFADACQHFLLLCG